jgi:ribosomal-protein-alanine N-acetyltransferase
MPILIRQALPTEATVLAAIHAQCFARPWDAQAISQFLDVPGCLVLVAAQHTDEPAQGFLIVRTAADEAELITLGVLPAHRRHGIARALLENAANLLREGGTKSLFLEVNEENLAALSLYRSLGARQVGRRIAYYEEGGDAAIFSLALSGSGSDDDD